MADLNKIVDDLSALSVIEAAELSKLLESAMTGKFCLNMLMCPSVGIYFLFLLSLFIA